MTQIAEKFSEELSGNEEWKEELRAKLEGVALKDQYAVLADFAGQKGYALEPDDFAQEIADMDLEELSAVAGGGGCGCAIGGGGSGSGLSCVCALAGEGGVGTLSISQGYCVCVAAGAGATHRH